MAKPVRKVTCYSGGEGAFMEASQRARARALGPFLRGLARLGLRPNHLTLLSLLSGLAFCPLFFVSRPVAFVCLALHVILDGLDGPLAREMGIASNRGSFTDSMSDQMVIAATTFTVVHAGAAGILPGGLYVFFYTVVVLFAMARNALDVPYSWLFRPRFLVYIWIAVEVYWLPGTLDLVLWGCVALLSAKTLTGFIRIRRRM